MPKLIAIYSVGTDDYGIDKLEGNKRGVYIYEKSVPLLKEIDVGDIVLLNITGKSKGILFKIENKSQIISNYSGKDLDKEGNAYIIIDETSKSEFSLSIIDFKNLYFLNFDILKSWVRSPLATKNNVLIFENENEILPDFINYNVLKKVLSSENLNNYLRNYIFTKKYNPKLLGENKQNIVTIIDNKKNQFTKEYSVFNLQGKINKDIQINFEKDFSELEKIFGKQNKMRLDSLKENNYEYILYTYSAYYDLTRVEQNKGKENGFIDNFVLKLEENLEEKKQELNVLLKKIDENNKSDKINKSDKTKEFLIKESDKIKEELLDKTKEVVDADNAFAIDKLKNQKTGEAIKHHSDIMNAMYSVIKKNLDKYNDGKEGEKKEDKINDILPILRLIYIMDRKEEAENFLQIGEVVNKFDIVLENYENRNQKFQENKQKREHKEKSFKQVGIFFIIELLLLTSLITSGIYFGKIELNNLYTISFISLIITATLAQITTMFYHIIKNLYPVDPIQVDKLPTTDFVKTFLDAYNEKLKNDIENNGK